MHEDFVPAEGRSVVVQLAVGEWRPAQIVRVWSETTLNLVVFVDGSNDARRLYPNAEDPIATERKVATNPFTWMTSVTRGNGIRQWQPRKPASCSCGPTEACSDCPPTE